MRKHKTYFACPQNAAGPNSLKINSKKDKEAANF